jgi:dTDP-4-amino-4,6-dideoxygalactose transaminase
MRPRFCPDYRLSDLIACLLPARSGTVEALEAEMARRAGHAEAVAFRYGRSGLFYLLEAIGARGKKVVMPSYTCVVVANAVVAAGAVPVFIDNARDAWFPNAEGFLSAIDADTAMIIPTHAFGIAQDTAMLYQSVKARHPHVFVLQDCAHSFFCRDTDGRLVTEHGDGAIFGMNISKLVNAVRGGVLTLRDPAVAATVRQRRDAGASAATLRDSLSYRFYALAAGIAFEAPLYSLVHFLRTRTRLLDSETKYFDPDRASLPQDFRARLPAFGAKIALASLRRLDFRVEARREIAAVYISKLRELEQHHGWALRTPAAERDPKRDTWSHFPVYVGAESRDLVASRLEREIDAEVGIIIDYGVASLPCHVQPGNICPRAAADAAAVINLPLTWREGIVPSPRWRARAEAACAALERLLAVKPGRDAE